MFIIEAKATSGRTWFYADHRSGFVASAAQALRFKDRAIAQRKSEQSVHCRRAREMGAKLTVLEVER